MKTFYNFLVGEWYCIKRWYWDTKFAIKSWYQRRTKGYANSECWNLCFSTSEWILPRLKYLRNNLNGTPPNLERCSDNNDPSHCATPENLDKTKSEDRYSLTLDEWKDKLDKMIYAFEFVINEDDIIQKCYPADYKWGFTTKDSDKEGIKELVWNDDRKPDYIYFNECEAKYKDGIFLFQLYFKHLWD